MTTTDQAAPPTYTFGRRDRGGLLLGFRAKQIALLGEGFLAVLTGLVLGGARGGLLGAAILATLATIALFPIQGRPVVDWVRPLANHAYARTRGRTRYLGGESALHRCRDTATFDLPGLGQGLRVYETTTPAGPVAALRLRDRSAGSCSSRAPVRGWEVAWARPWPVSAACRPAACADSTPA